MIMNKEIRKMHKKTIDKTIKIVKNIGCDYEKLINEFKKLALNDYEIEKQTKNEYLNWIIHCQYEIIVIYFFNERMFKMLSCYMINEMRSGNLEKNGLYSYFKCLTKVIFNDMTREDIKIGFEKYESF